MVAKPNRMDSGKLLERIYLGYERLEKIGPNPRRSTIVERSSRCSRSLNALSRILIRFILGAAASLLSSPRLAHDLAHTVLGSPSTRVYMPAWRLVIFLAAAQIHPESLHHLKLFLASELQDLIGNC
jgi:hypothetical protein